MKTRSGLQIALQVALRIAILCTALFFAVAAQCQLGVNCGEHPNLFRKRSGIVWFAPEQMEKMSVKKFEPVMPATAAGFQYDGYITYKILVDTKGEIGCIWAGAGNSMFLGAVNRALQSWTFKPMMVEGKPVEFVGTMRFHVHTN